MKQHTVLNYQRLSDQAHLDPRQYAFPIYTAISTGKTNQIPAWFEYTPYQMGSQDYGQGLYIPTWAVGRTFLQGYSTNFAIEPHLGFHWGTFGSAFSARFSVLLTEIKSKIGSRLLQDLFESMVLHTVSPDFLTKRLPESWGQIWNYMRGIPESGISDDEILKLSDAGLDFNLPYPPISGRRPERKADIIIFIDVSESMAEPTALLKSQEYAQRYHLPFPEITGADLVKKGVTVLHDTADLNTPLVIYMPRVQDPELYARYAQDPGFTDILQQLKGFNLEKESTSGFCQVGNMNYTPAQARLVMAAAEFKSLRSYCGAGHSHRRRLGACRISPLIPSLSNV